MGHRRRGRFRRAVLQADLARRVAEQRIGEVELLGERTALLDRIEAAADDLRVELAIFVRKVPEPGPLVRSAGCVGLRKKPEDDILSAEVSEPQRRAGMRRRREIGCDASDRRHVAARAGDHFDSESKYAQKAHARDCTRTPSMECGCEVKRSCRLRVLHAAPVTSSPCTTPVTK